jgi:hypothetical protein
LQFAAQNLHEGGLAGAVGADQTIPIAVAKAQRDIFKQWFCTKLNGDIRGSDQGGIRSAKCHAGTQGRKRGICESGAL